MSIGMSHDCVSQNDQLSDPPFSESESDIEIEIPGAQGHQSTYPLCSTWAPDKLALSMEARDQILLFLA